MEKFTSVELIMLGFCAIVLVICVIVFIINLKKLKNLYNRTKNKSYQDKVWSWFIEDASKFIYNGCYEYKPGKLVHEWLYGHYRILVWLSVDRKDNAYSSIHTDGYYFDGNTINKAGECVLCSFNYYRSKQLASILLRDLWVKKIHIYGNR